MARIVIMGGGPAGYEAALVAAQYGAEVTLIESDGIGGNCVLYDCVPSKTFIASAGARSAVREAGRPRGGVSGDDIVMKLNRVHQRVHDLAAAQSDDIRNGLVAMGVKLVTGGPGSRTGPPASRCTWSRSPRPTAVSRSGPGRRGTDRHRGQPAGAADRGTGRRTHPDLASGLRPA